MKRIWIFVAALVLLAGIVPVRAQGVLNGGYRPSSWEGWIYYFEGDQAHMLQADNIEYVRQTLGIGRRAQVRNVADDLARSGPYVGLQGPKGFYPLYQCSGGQRWKRGIGTVLLAGGIGYIVGHTTRFGEREGVAAGLGIGTGLALYLDANKCSPVQNKMVVIDDPSDVGEEDSQPSPRMRGISTPAPSAPAGRENGWNERLRQQRYRNQPQALAPVELEWQWQWQMLRNEFQGVTIYARVQGLDPDQPIVISPSQTVTVQIPRGSQIWVEAQVCIDDGCTVQRWRQDVGRRPLPQGAGWVYYNPEEGR